MTSPLSAIDAAYYDIEDEERECCNGEGCEVCDPDPWDTYDERDDEDREYRRELRDE